MERQPEGGGRLLCRVCAVGAHAVRGFSVPYRFLASQLRFVAQAVLFGGLNGGLKKPAYTECLATACVAEPHTLRRRFQTTFEAV